VTVWIGLPLTNWNGRFQGTGGGGFLGGHPNSLRGPIRLGFSAGATDTGHEGGSGKFALDANGRQDWQAIINNAYLGIHEMTVAGKALTKAFYGRAPRYSYFVRPADARGSWKRNVSRTTTMAFCRLVPRSTGTASSPPASGRKS